VGKARSLNLFLPPPGAFVRGQQQPQTGPHRTGFRAVSRVASWAECGLNSNRKVTKSQSPGTVMIASSVLLSRLIESDFQKHLHSPLRTWLKAARIRAGLIWMAAAAEAAEAAANACCHCGAPDVVIDYMQRLRICVCEPCMRRHEKLISKVWPGELVVRCDQGHQIRHQTVRCLLPVQSNANSMYLLSDADLHTVGFLEKLNPRHQRFAPMKQYLISQVSLSASSAATPKQIVCFYKQYRVATC